MRRHFVLVIPRVTLYSETVNERIHSGELYLDFAFRIKRYFHNNDNSQILFCRADVMAGIFFLSSLLCHDQHTRMVRHGDQLQKSPKMICDNNNYCKLPSGGKKSRHKSRANNNTWLVLTTASAACSMFCKEQGITVLSVCILTEIVRGGSRYDHYQVLK